MIFGREAGVAVPRGQLRDPNQKVEPGRVLNAAPVQYCAVQYGNEYGEVVTEIWLKMGGRYYVAPGAEAFASGVREVKEAHARQVDALIAQKGDLDELQAENAVDVVSRQTAEEVKAAAGVEVV